MGTRRGCPTRIILCIPPFSSYWSSVLAVCIFLPLTHLLITHLLLTHSLTHSSIPYSLLHPTKAGFSPYQYYPVASDVTKDLLIAAQFHTPHLLQSLPSPGSHDTAARVFKHAFSSRTLLQMGSCLELQGINRSFIVRIKIMQCKSLKFILLFQGSFGYLLHFQKVF